MKNLVEDLVSVVQDPERLRLLATIVDDPKWALERLDLLIRSEKIPEESRKRYRELRNSLEDYVTECTQKKVYDA